MLNKNQTDILNGALLGDGSLIMHKQGKNAYFSYTSKHKEHVEYIFKHFKKYCNYKELKYTEYFDKRTNKIYSRYYFRTKCLEFLTKLYNIWYKNNKKIIPIDLILNSTINLIWYIGDGSLSGMIKLSTDCFTENELNEIIIPQLLKFNPKIYKNNNNPRIYIPRIKVKSFLEHMGDCPLDCYKYKWDYREYKYKIYENDMYYTNENDIKKFIKLYKSGVSYFKIAKMLNFENGRVLYYLKQAGIYIKNRDKFKRPLSNQQLDEIQKMRYNGVCWKQIENTYNVGWKKILHYIKNRI